MISTHTKEMHAVNIYIQKCINVENQRVGIYAGITSLTNIQRKYIFIANCVIHGKFSLS